jgi:hypothetical protein
MIQNVLEVFSTLGIVVNCGLLVTFGVIQKIFPSVTYFQSIIVVIILEVSVSILEKKTFKN